MGARVVGAAVLLLLLASCDAICGPIPVASVQQEHNINCVDAQAPHHAYVVVQHASGAWVERCVGFAPGFIDAAILMSRAGIAYASRDARVCAVDGEPASATTCGQNDARHWAVFVASGDRWSLTTAPFDDVQVVDAQAVGLRYVAATDASPAPPPLPHRLPG
jgi:hypothetical protein